MDSRYVRPFVRCLVACALCSAMLLSAVAGAMAVKRPDVGALQGVAEAAQWESLKEQATADSQSDMLTDKELAQAFTYLALAELNLDSPGPALDAADRSVSLDDTNARGWLMRGSAYMMLRQLAPAEEDFNKALHLEPGMWEAARNLAEVQLARGDLPAALDWFAKAVGLAPQNADLGMEYGLLLHTYGLHAKAEQVLTDTIVVAQDSPALFNNRGMVRLALDHYDDALSDFSRAIVLDPGNAEALVNRGNVLRAFKRYDDSLADFTAGISAHPDSIKLLIGRAYTLVAMGRYTDAATDMNSAYTLGNVDPYVLNEVAWFLATCPQDDIRDGNRAVRLSREAIGLVPNPVPGYYDTLAAAYAADGMFADAIEVQTQALSLGRRAGLTEPQLKEWQERLEGYEQKIPYHIPPQQ